MQTLRKKTSPCKYRNDPGRFFGDGVQFKAKLIGILEVGEARGDRMCQEALQDLKMAIRAAGEHKQRITIHVTIDGLRLRDEKTGDSLYHHPVHKISFIAQDMTDSRAFGYIFGSPDSGHRFFGIKTDKAASQVVLAMRDLFQVVFELKKKEIELARQQIQSKSLHHHDQHHLSSLSSLKSAAAGTAGQNDLSGLGGSTTSAATLSMLNTMVSSSTNTPNASRLGVNLDSKGASKEISPESVADLVDLEQELSSLQRGITQMERITPNDAHSHQNNSLSSTANKTAAAGASSDDPFGDSFTNFPTLPPPEPGRLRSKNATPKNNDLTNIPITSAGNNSLLSSTATQSGLTSVSIGLNTTITNTATSNTVTLQPLDDDDDNWLRELDAHSDVFDTSKTIVPGLMGMPPLASSLASSVPLATRAPLAARESSDTPTNHIYETVSCSANAITTDIVELTTIASTTANNNAESTNLTNSSSLTDIFQTAATEANQNSKSDIKSDAFTDLDPLGTGRTRPYVDRKYFFQELKNPPKKVLKDLTTCTTTTTTTTATINTTTNAITTTTTTLTTANIVMANLTATTTTTATNLMGNFREDILSLSDLELKTVKYQQQQQQQQQHMQQQQLKMSHCTLNNLLTTTSTANAAITPSAILSSSSSSCTTTTTTATTTNILITANAINYATTGTTTTTPTNTNTTNATTITTANSYHNNKNHNKNSNATTTTTATTARNFICNTYKTGIDTTSITTCTALNNSKATASAIAIATINTNNMIQANATIPANATATNTSTTATTNVNNFNVNTNIVNVQSNVKNSITVSAFSTTVSASSSTCATALTSNSLICTCPTSIIVTCTTTNASSTNNLRYTTTTNATNNNSNNTNTNIKSNSNNNNNNCINNSSSATSISRNSINKSFLSHNINKKNTNSSSLLPTTTVVNQYQTSLSLSLSSSSSSSISQSQSPLRMKLNSNLIKSSNGGSCYTAAAAAGGSGGGGGYGFAVGEVGGGGVAGQIQSSASASLSSTSSLTTTTPKLGTITTAIITTTTTTTTSNSTTTVTTTNTTSTSTTQSTIMTQTNALRFSRYYPPLEPVAVAVASDPVMLPRDTDPFSPTRKKSDPFEEGGDIFSKLDPFEFEFNSSGSTADAKDKTRKSSSPPAEQQQPAGGGIQTNQDILSGHLQVNLPPESDLTQTTSTIRSRPVPSAMIGINNSGPQSAMGGSLPPAAILKQQTVDVISSISNKKMPHLFGQSSRFSKRDSNSINMRRLQESDSLSETETAPEPPPRPDSASYVEPPPLPPKKQFNDIIIRPRQGPSPTLSSSAGNRYYGLTSSILTSSSSSTKGITARSNSSDVPPIPLPSRRVGRTDGSYPGPGRPRKPGHTEDDYLAPITLFNSTTTSAALSNSSNITDVPPLLPPPTQISSRARNQRQQSLTQQNKVHDIYENKSEILQQLQQQQQQQQQLQKQENAPAPNIVPDITLTQLLTLGIDELAVKLNVPTTKLSTMTLVELTSYLSEFLEQSKPKHEQKILHPPEDLQQQQQLQQPTTPIFKVNFDQEATFVAKFDDTFGEDFHQQLDIGGGGSSMTFEANFAQFDNMNVEPPAQAAQQNASVVPPADRYAVFREIIDQELQQQQESVDLIGDIMETENLPTNDDKQFESSPITDLNINISHQQDLLSGDMLEVSGPQPPKIDTKISEVLAQAKDRYAALRDLILVENLFDKPPPPKPPSISTDMDGTQSESKSPFQGFTGFNDDEEDQDLRQLMDQTSTLDVNTQQQRLGLVDSRGFLVEPSSSAITVEEDEDEEEEDRRNTREDIGGISSADSNEKEQDKDTLPTSQYEQLASSNQQLEEIEEKPEKYDEITPQISITQSQMPSGNDSKYLSVTSVASSGLSGSKDDLEIDDLMQRAISNLSLDSRERNSPATQVQQQQNTHTVTSTMTPPHFNDVSTSPIPLQRSPGPSLTSQPNKSPSNKSSQQVSPLPSQLTVVSQIIDAATKQIQNENVTKTANDSWATFDTPQHQPQVVASDKRARPSAKIVAKGNNFLNLPPPPGSISNCSQNDSAIESPCSSDPREEAWHKHTMGGSSLSLGHQTAGHVSSLAAQRRYHKKERQNTSSSSRDLSWDEDQGSIPPPPPPHVMDYPPSKRLPGQSQGSLTTDRHGYYRRHARRMNSCDDDYEYDPDYATSRRDQCKYKHSLSRSRDNFEMDSPGWYHHHAPQHAHNTWSSQDIEQARGRAFERSAYERTTYGPPIYDKRSVGPPLPPPTSSYDRRSAGSAVGGYDKRGKYYRGDLNSRPSNTERIYNLDDFDEMLAASGKIPPHLASMYEEMKTECCSPPLTSHRTQRAADYMYERDRKSFDRESLESYEGSNVAPRRRRRSYDSGGIPSDPYGSCDSRDEYHGRERCVMSGEKSRSLRKSMKSLRGAMGDIDYDQDSEKEYHYRDQRARCDARSLQRPSQLSTQGGIGSSGGLTGANIMGSQGRIRKSSGSSPWDGEEPPLPGQKSSTSSWKRPSSAAESERRRAVAKGQTPSGSDEDKDRRYRKKRTTRNKDLSAIPSSANRYGRGANYDYISCEDLDDDAEDYVDEEEEEEVHGIEHDEISPADEDKFARLEMRRHEMHNRMMDAHVRRRKEVPTSQTQVVTSMVAYRKGVKGGYIRRPLPPPTEHKHPQDYGFDDDGDDGEYEQTPTPRSNTSSALPTATPNTSTKFSFDVGFESDFNQSSPPPAPAGTASSCNSTPAANASTANTPAASKSSFRFSNDFSAGQEREKHFQHPPAGPLQQYDVDNRGLPPQTSTQTSTPKLRFDDNVKVSQFDDAFEDDFSKATFDAFPNDEVQWQESLTKTAKQQIRNNKLQQRQQELIKKSESVNIFAKKVEDPFEDDEFFNSPPVPPTTSNNSNDKTENHKTTASSNGNGNGNGGGGGVGGGGGGGVGIGSSNNGNGTVESSGWDDDNTNFAKFDENM